MLDIIEDQYLNKLLNNSNEINGNVENQNWFNIKIFLKWNQ